MPEYTTRLNLPKPLGNENVTRANHNALVDAIDANAAKKSDLDTVNQQISSLSGDLTGHKNATDPHSQYALDTDLTTHSGDTTKHITADERLKWNDIEGKAVSTKGGNWDLADLNNYSDPGVYYISNSTPATNGVGLQYFVLTVFKGHNGYISQNVQDIGNKSLWTRTMQNGVWKDWKQIVYAEILNWINATLQNSWVTYGGSTPGYSKDGLGIVHLRGRISSGTLAQNTVILTLPAGYRPASLRKVTTSAWTGTGNAGIAVLNINTDGTVTIDYATGNSWLSLDNIHFQAEQ